MVCPAAMKETDGRDDADEKDKAHDGDHAPIVLNRKPGEDTRHFDPAFGGMGLQCPSLWLI
jgi:hypothetical protein